MRDADHAARILKGLEERIRNLEEDDQELAGVQKHRGKEYQIPIESNIEITIENSDTGDTETIQTQNTATEDMQQYLSRQLQHDDREITRPRDIAFGIGDPDLHPENDELAESVGNVPIIDSPLVTNETEVILTGFLDSSRLNGEELTELAVVNEDRFFNHAEISPPITKNEAVTATIEVTFGFTV